MIAAGVAPYLTSTDYLFQDSSGRHYRRLRDIDRDAWRIDYDAVYSVLKLGAVVPPLSPFEGIARVAPALPTRERVDAGAARDGAPRAGLDEQKAIIKRLLDDILVRRIGSCREPVIMFSGGVDSGLLASRVKALGYDRALLVNYAFGSDDAESALAQRMAARIGLRFLRVEAKQAKTSVLAAPGKTYDMPFGDDSVAPTAELAAAVCSALGESKTMIIDGTGADGGFGLHARLRASRIKATLVPAPVQWLAGSAYDAGLWGRKGALERFTKRLCGSKGSSAVCGFIAQNPLDGVIYGAGARARVEALLDGWMRAVVGSEFRRAATAADLALVCANIFAQKARPIFESHGHETVFPFLEPPMVELMLGAGIDWKMSTAKAPLKALLCEIVPQDMVFRPKSGFVDPRAEVFHDATFLEYLAAVTDDASPIGCLLDRKRIGKLVALLHGDHALPAQTEHFVWAVVFADRWYRTFAD